MNSYLDNLTEYEISKKLNNFIKDNTNRFNKFDYHELQPLSDNPVSAAVLVPLQRINSSWHVVFIHRNPEMNEHAGQVAFPGGHRSIDDASLEDTALREAYEEIGLKSQDVQIIGNLPETYTVTNYKITPFVGCIPYPYKFQLSPNEVARAFTIPISWLSDPNNFSYVTKNFAGIPQPVEVIYYKPYIGEVLWGASARITHLLLSALVSEE